MAVQNSLLRSAIAVIFPRAVVGGSPLGAALGGWGAPLTPVPETSCPLREVWGRS